MNDDDMLLVVIVDYFYVFMMVGYFSWGNDILGLLKRFNFFMLIFRIFMCFNIRWFFDLIGVVDMEIGEDDMFYMILIYGNGL